MRTLTLTTPLLLAGLLALAGCNPPAENAPPVDAGNVAANTPSGTTEAAGNAPTNTPETGSTEGVSETTEGAVPVVMETSMGTIELALDPKKAPKTVANFVNYARKGHYDGTIFHRVISDFMIQGGGYDKDLNEKPTDPPIENEGQNGLKNVRGSIAMARTGQPDSATSQFFISVADNTGKLDYPLPDGFGYAVFGKVTKGMDVVDKIRSVTTGSKNGMDDVPVETVTIKSVKVKE